MYTSRDFENIAQSSYQDSQYLLRTSSANRHDVSRHSSHNFEVAFLANSSCLAYCPPHLVVHDPPICSLGWKLDRLAHYVGVVGAGAHRRYN